MGVSERGNCQDLYFFNRATKSSFKRTGTPPLIIQLLYYLRITTLEGSDGFIPSRGAPCQYFIV
jgi:hypothetical protein